MPAVSVDQQVNRQNKEGIIVRRDPPSLSGREGIWQRFLLNERGSERAIAVEQRAEPAVEKAARLADWLRELGLIQSWFSG